MVFVRRFLPPMALLTAFEAAARHRSVTAAAEELSLTQSAVSRQIRALEDIVGSPLFVRERQTIKLTRAGASYAQDIRDALKRISAATLGFRANPEGSSLNLAILPMFGTRWLAPRLGGFLEENPSLTVNLTTRLEPFDFQFDTVDAAIHFGEPKWQGAELQLLMRETTIPTCSPKLRKKFSLKRPSDLRRAPLLHIVSRPDAWEHWFRIMGVDVDTIHGMLLDQFATATQAAISGLGVALLPRFLIESELSRGDLVEVISESMESSGSYYLAWPISRSNHQPLMVFRNWIAEQISQNEPG